MKRSSILVSTILASFLFAGCGDTKPPKQEVVQGDLTELQTQTVVKVKVSKSSIITGKSIDYEISSDNNIANIEWRDIDGKLLSTDKKFNRFFKNEGSYITVLTVTDIYGKVGTDTIIVKVNRDSTPDPVDETSNKPPIVKAKAIALEIMDKESIHLSDDGSYDSDGSIVKYEWRDMDGILLSTTKKLNRVMHYWPQYDFKNNGTTRYIKTLYVTDDKGAVSSQDFVIIVRKKPTLNQAPTVDAGANQIVTVGTDVTLTAVASDSDGEVVSYEWKEGATVAASTASFTTVDLAPGTHIFTVTVTDDDGAVNSDTVNVVVEEVVVENKIPWAHDMTAFFYSGPSQDKTVQLKGTDADGDSLTYEITQMPIGNVGTNYAFDPATGVLSFTSIADLPSNVDIVKYRVYDGKDFSRIATAYIRFSFAPTTNLGADRLIIWGEPITLTANASDEDGTIETYVWKLDGNEIAGAESLTLDGLAVGDHEVSLFVRDNNGLPSRIETINIEVVPADANHAPTVQDKTVNTNEDVSKEITLTGNDTNGDALTYTVVTAPSHGTFVGTTYTPNPNYNGVDSFTFKANDGTVDSEVATVTINIASIDDFPTANAGADQNVEEGATVQLDGSGSSTADGEITKYIWSFSSKPAGSTATFSDVSAVNPTFTADTEGEYKIRLQVFDDNQDFDGGNDEVIITVNPMPRQSKLLKTGQTKSYDEEGVRILDDSIKDDGFYKAGVDRNFTRDNVNNIMIDNVSGAVWQNDSDVGSVTKSWSGSEAINYCEGKAYDGSTMDLPKIADLFYLKNHGGILDTGFSGGNPTFELWSADTVVEDTGYAWVMKYVQDLDGWADKTEDRRIRCIKKTGNEYKGDFARDAATNTVEDREANLIWQDSVEVQINDKITWRGAIEYCENLVFASSSAWRLPNINELYSIGDRSISKPAIRNQFNNVEQDYYWSSTTDYEDEHFLAQAVEFEEGNTARLDKGTGRVSQDKAYVRCVRDK